MPPVTTLLIAANAGVFLLLVAGPRLLTSFALWPVGAGFQPWQLLTYAFLHGSVTHLFFNMLALMTFLPQIHAAKPSSEIGPTCSR